MSINYWRYLVKVLRGSFRRLPGGKLHEREIFSGNDPDRPQLSEAVERVAEILNSNLISTDNDIKVAETSWGIYSLGHAKIMEQAADAVQT